MIPVLLIFGAQGSGKSTQGKLIASNYNIPYYDAGQSLRDFSASTDPDAARVSEMMKRGEIVGNDILKKVFAHFIKHNNITKGFVLDGFPRTKNQINLLEDLASQYNWKLLGIFIKISDSTAKIRLASRLIEKDGVQIRRDDDAPEIVDRRLANFKQETMPIIEHLIEKGVVLKIDGEPKPDSVYQQTINKIQDFFAYGSK